MLDNVELIMYIQFQKLLMTGCRDMDKEHQKYPKNGGFPHLWPPKIFFLLHPYGALTACKKLGKNNGLMWTNVLTDKGDYDGSHRVNPGSKIRMDKTSLVANRTSADLNEGIKIQSKSKLSIKKLS